MKIMKKLLFKLFITLLFVCFIFIYMINASFAWISKEDKSSINNLDMNVDEVVTLGISSDSLVYGNLLSITTDGKKLMPLIYDINNDSLITLDYEYVLNRETNLYEKEYSYGETARIDSYIEEDFSLKCPNNSRIGIDLNRTSITGSNILNAYNINTSFIKCAMRVMIYKKESDNYNLLMVYFPYASYELKYANNIYYIDEDGYIDYKFTFYDASVVNREFDSTLFNNGYIVSDDVYYVFKDTGKVYFYNNSSSINEFRIRIYIDGFDNEACNKVTYNDENNNIFANLQMVFNFCIE